MMLKSTRSRQQSATQVPTTTELYWAAGFLEGEGWFGIQSNHSHSVVCTNTDTEPLKRLQAIFGGNIRRSPRKWPHNDLYYWALYGARARGVMMTLFSLLSARRKHRIRTALSGKRVRVASGLGRPRRGTKLVGGLEFSEEGR